MKSVFRAPFIILVVPLLILAFLPGILAKQHVNPDSNIIILFFQSLSSISDYFSLLLKFGTLDFQPLRDLAIFIEIRVYEHFGINTTIVANILVWVISLLFIEKILTRLNPLVESNTRKALVLLFAIHPAFSTSVLWGMAIKHLLSFMFICIATYFLILSTEIKKLSYVVLSSVLFLLSLLSQPINIHWGLWAVIFTYLISENRRLIKMIAFTTLPSMLILGLVNYFYYQTSEVFKYLYNAKFDSSIEIGDKILALGHYFSQLIIPIDLVYQYQLGTIKQFIGIVLFVLFVFFLLKWERKKEGLIWFGFAIPPMLLVSNSPIIITDTYLLTPGLGLLIILQYYLGDLKSYWLRWVFALLLVPFIYICYQYSKVWTDPLDFTQNSFLIQPSCDSAMTSARVSLENTGTFPKKEKIFIMHNKCLSSQLSGVPELRKSQIKMISLAVFYDEATDSTDRFRTLKNLSRHDSYAKLVLAALHAKEGDKDNVAEALKNLKGTDLLPGNIKDYDRVAALYLRPFCLQISDTHCLSVTENLITKIQRMWY